VTNAPNFNQSACINNTNTSDVDSDSDSDSGSSNSSNSTSKSSAAASFLSSYGVAAVTSCVAFALAILAFP